MSPSRHCLPGLASLFLMTAWLSSSGFGAVRFDVVGSPTEVIHTGRSEVLGSINLIVRGTGNVTGTSMGGAAQIGFLFADPALQIDNTTNAGIRLFASPGLAPATPSIVSLGNRDIGGRCAGFLAINLQPGATPADGDYIRIEGIRGRIDQSSAITPGTDLFVTLQSANDPSATSFSSDRFRVATSFKGLAVEVASTSLTYEIHITEGFVRAFVDRDAGNDGLYTNDRTDSGGNLLGAPSNSTQIQIRLDGIPDGISDVLWPTHSTASNAGALLSLLSKSFSGSTAIAIYGFEAANQVGSSDLYTETFSVAPGFVFSGGRCNTERLSASVSLSPAASGPGSCDAPYDVASRPRFVERFELTLQNLSSFSAAAGSDGFTLHLLGSGFVPGSSVLWAGSPRPTTFESSTELSASIPASDLARPATVTVAVVNPTFLGGGSSNALSFLIGPQPLTLIFPRLRLGASTSGGIDSREYTGIALVNQSSRQAKLKLTAFDTHGSIIAGSGITNPATLTLNDGQQTPLLASELFGANLNAAGTGGWIKVEGNVPQVSGFFLSFDAGLSRLDGAEVSSNLQTDFLFSEIGDLKATQIHIANPDAKAAVVTLELVKQDGSPRGFAVTRTIAPNGALAEAGGDLFTGVDAEASDYIRASSDRGVTPFELIRGVPKDSAGLNGESASEGATLVYCPQYAVGGPDWNSTLTIINLSQKSGVVKLRFVTDDGTQAGSDRTLPISPLGKLRITDQSFFIPAGQVLIQGYLEITTDGIQIAGNVVFSNPTRNTFVSALPLVRRLRDKMVFSHLASNSTFFTGIALLNPDNNQTPAIIQVFDSTGAILASKTEIIPPRARISRLLTEIFPALLHREISSGYIIVTGMRNLAAFAVFGTRDLSVLSAIPAQILP